MATLPTLDPVQNALEVRPLPSAGITRCQRYYEPVRHPTRPGLSLAGVRLAAHRHRWGLPCCVRSPCTDMPSPLPRWDRRRESVAPLNEPATAAFPIPLLGRLPHYPFRGLLGVHSRYGLPARGTAHAVLCIEGFGSFVTSTTAPIATGWNDSCRVGFAPTEDRHLCTAHNVKDLRRPDVA